MTNNQYGLFQNAHMYQNTMQSQDDIDSKDSNSNMMHLENIPDDMHHSPKIFIEGTRTTLFFIFSDTTEQQTSLGALEINVQSTQTSVIFDLKTNEEFQLDAYLRSGYLQKPHINKFIKQSQSLILDGLRQIQNKRVVVELIIDTQKYISTDVLSPDFSACGLINEGNTCYMNSLLQILSHIRSFKNIIYSIKNVTLNKFPASLQELFYGMDQNRYSFLNIKKLLQSFDWSIDDAWVQHDVQEFFMMLLEGIDTRMKQISGINEDSDVIRLFSGKLQIKLNCIHVEECSQHAESFTDIQLVVQGTNNLDESLKLYVSKEQLRGDNCYFSNTHGLQEADKYITFQQLPEVLIFHLKRFAYIDGQMKKLLERFEFPEELSMGQYSNNDPQEYSLYGVLTHSGDALNSGHYVAYIKDFGSGQWVSFNDQTVKCVPSVKAVQGNFGGSQRVGKYCIQTQNIIEQSQVQKQSAYMLVYIRSADKLSRKSIQPIPQWLIERQEKQSQQEQRTLQRKELFQIQMIKYERVIEVVNQVKSFGQRGLILKRPFVNQRNNSYQNNIRLIQLQAEELSIPSEQTLGEFITFDNQQAFIYRALWDQRGILRAEVIFSINHYNRMKANVLKKALQNSKCTPFIITISQFTYDLGGDYIIFIKCIRKDSITLIPPMRLTQDLDLYSFTQQLIRDKEILQNCDLFIEDPYFQLHRVEEKLLREPLQKIYQTIGIASNCTLVFIEPQQQQLDEMYEFKCMDGQFKYIGNISLNQNSSYDELTIAIEAQGQSNSDNLLIKYWNGSCHQEIDLDIVQRLGNLENNQGTGQQSLIPYISKYRNELICINHPVTFIHRQTQFVWEFSIYNESQAQSLACSRDEIISTVIQRQLPQQYNLVLLMDCDQKYLDQVFPMQKLSQWTVDKVLRYRVVLFQDEDLQQNLKKTLIICNFRIGYKKYDSQLHPFWLFIDENSTLQNLIQHIHDTLQKKYSYDDRKVQQITMFASTDKTLTSSTGRDIRNMQLLNTIGQSFFGEMSQKKVYIDIQSDQSKQLKLNCN